MLHFHIWYFPFLVLIWFLGIDPGKENVEDTRKCDRSSGHNKRLWDRCPEIYNLFGNSWPGPLSFCNFFFYLFRARVVFINFCFHFFSLVIQHFSWQDLNLSMERLSANKAFTNKLWNAGKFILQNVPDKSDASAWELLLTNKVRPICSSHNIPSLNNRFPKEPLQVVC